MSRKIAGNQMESCNFLFKYDKCRKYVNFFVYNIANALNGIKVLHCFQSCLACSYLDYILNIIYKDFTVADMTCV